MEYIITRSENEDELYHHGVKGMKWGHRKAQVVSGNPVGMKKSTSKSAKKENKAKRAIKNASKPLKKETAAKAVKKGLEITTKLATLSLVDDIFYGGRGKQVVKKAGIATGRAVVTASLKARGATDIRWFDN